MFMSMDDYRKKWMEEIRNEAAMHQTSPDDQFLTDSLALLQDYGEIIDANIFYFEKNNRRNRKMKFDAYSIDEADGSLVFLINDFSPIESPPALTNTKIDDLLAQMECFLEEVEYGSLGEYCDDSDEALKISRMIHYKLGIDGIKNGDSEEIIHKIKFFIITNSKLSISVKNISKPPFLNRPVELNIWSIERFYTVASTGMVKEPIKIIPADFGIPEGIPCIKAEMTGNETYDAYLSIIPGSFLASIYEKHGSRLLEGNVRAFLSTKAKVNKGIRKTIAEAPTNFFAYNNGISTTASKVDLQKNGDGLRIVAMDDLQIINGGQTTASLASAKMREKLNLSNIFVPMKLTVVKDADYNEMIANIARYANSQNRVTDADLFSNHQFHIVFEKMSKQFWAPLSKEGVFQTKWYYERARGKYQQEITLAGSSKAQSDFQKEYPKSQIITKEQLAKYLLSLNCKPHIVSAGAMRSMNAFANEIDSLYKSNPFIFNEQYFKKAVCSAIIFRRTDDLVYNLPWYITGGYKSNIVTYTIAKIMASLPKGKTLNFNWIWKIQQLYPSLQNEIAKCASIVNDFILDSGGTIVTEYCKKVDTWEKMKLVPYAFEPSFLDDLYDEEMLADEVRSAQKDARDDKKVSIQIQAVNIGAQYWTKAYEFCLSKKMVDSTRIGILKLAANMDKPGAVPPSEKQAKILLDIKEYLENKGIFLK